MFFTSYRAQYANRLELKKIFMRYNNVWFYVSQKKIKRDIDLILNDTLLK